MSVAWDAMVDAARSESVDAVIIAGDLVDRENRRFEPIGAVERGLTTLARHGIPVIVVAGDEDVETIRTLAANDTSGALIVLGADGTWETTTITSAAGDTLTIAGWSAPGRSISGSPVTGLADALGDSSPDVVVLHGSPGSRASGFAPIPVSQIKDGPGALWITGAPFAPFVDAIEATTLLIPGSVAALSPVDTGTRGAWIVDIADGRVDLRQHPVAAVRFDHVDVDLTGCADSDDVESRIIGALQATLQDAVNTNAGGNLLAVCAHLTLYGRTPVFAALPNQLDEIQRTVDLQHQGVVLAITSVTNNAEPAIELGLMLERTDPVGETARLLRALDTASVDDMDAPYQELLRRTATRLSSVHRSRVFAAIASDPEPDLDAAKALLRREAWTTLDALVRQRGIDQEGQQVR